MKRIKDFLDLIVTVVKAWPYLLVGLTVVFSIVVWLAGFGATMVQFAMPLPLVVVFIALAIYPIVKTIEWLLRKKSLQVFPFNGLLWKPSRFRFKYPAPICPEKDCGCEVFCKVEQSISIRPVQPGIFEPQAKDHFAYECPVHGVLHDVPDISIRELQIKARLVQSRQTSKSVVSKNSVAR